MTPAWIRRQVLLYASRIAKYATLAQTSNRASYGAVDQPPGAEDEGAQPGAQPVRILQWFGFRSRPVKGSECIVIAARGGATNAVLVAADSFGSGPTDLKEGETAIFCKKSGTLIKLDENGKITIVAAAGQNVTVDAGAGGNVVVNGGTLDVARKTDQVQVTIPVGAIEVGGMPLKNTNVITATGTISAVGQTRFKG